MLVSEYKVILSEQTPIYISLERETPWTFLLCLNFAINFYRQEKTCRYFDKENLYFQVTQLNFFFSDIIECIMLYSRKCSLKITVGIGLESIFFLTFMFLHIIKNIRSINSIQENWYLSAKIHKRNSEINYLLNCVDDSE